MIISHVGLINPVTKNHNRLASLIVNSNNANSPGITVTNNGVSLRVLQRVQNGFVNALEVGFGNSPTGLLSLNGNGLLTVGGQVTAITFQAAGTGTVLWTNRCRMSSPSDGVILFLNSGSADFTRLNFGGTTSSFPALGRSTIFTSILLADGTAGGGLQLSEGASIDVGTTTGSKIGNSVLQKIGLFNVTPIIQPAAAGQAALTNSTGGDITAVTLVDVTTAAVSDPVKVNNNFARVFVLLDAMRTAMVNLGSMKGAA